MLMWLNVQYGYMSKRHTLAFATLGSIFIPGGIVICSAWISSRIKFSRKIRVKFSSSAQISFSVLIILGFIICLFTLAEPSRSEKRYYLTAANWLKEHTSKTDIIMVSDRRIAFYADRKFRVYTDLDKIDEMADYLVVLTHKHSNIPEDGMGVFYCSDMESHGIRVFKLTKSR